MLTDARGGQGAHSGGDKLRFPTPLPSPKKGTMTGWGRTDYGVIPCVQQGLFNEDQNDGLLTFGKFKNTLLSSKSISRHYVAFFYVILEHSFFEVPESIKRVVWEWGEHKSLDSVEKEDFRFFEELVDGWRLRFDLREMEEEE